ncbi:PREDICTED: FRIGIDA-like protein 4a [Populus euphratica]|uniref:FRIGIDA-like protein n=1 Tax=Populus euphratica TaxID=75702 RepID=A0AAJ6Y5W0_POPEU|nr:PREDICTED: FRIGIDA-like protein 4a [Populus euphratica]
MATEITIETERTQKFFNDLDARKTFLSSCTQLFTTLTTHFKSLQTSLSQKSQSLESKFQSLESNSQLTLESLSCREKSIPERESAAAAKVEEQRETALSEFRNSHSFDNLSDSLKSLCRRMDSSGLLRFVVSKRKESVFLRAEISRAIMEAVDPARLTLDAVDELVRDKVGKVGVTDKRWACGILVQALFPEGSCFGRKDKGPEFARSVVERAAGILDNWKEEDEVEEKADGEGGGGGGGVVGPAEAVMFLQMVLGFGLKSRFDEEFLRKLVAENASRRDMAKLAAAIGFGEKMGDIIDELVKNGKEIEAVYFASESGLTKRFSPVSLLKSYLKNSKKITTTVLKNGNYSAAATDESSTLELNSIKAIIKCVEDHKLESEFSLDSLRKRASLLEKTKAERKRGTSAATATKSQNKRGHGSSGGRDSGPTPYRQAKAAKFSNNYSSFSRRNSAPPAQHSPARRYSGPFHYPSQNVYEGPAAAPYASTYGISHAQSPSAISQQPYHHSQSPSAIPQQLYSQPAENMSAAGFRASGSYGSQTNYGAYDYGSAAPVTYQPSPYTQ